MNIQTLKDYNKRIPDSAKRGANPPYASESLIVQGICVHQTGQCTKCGLRYVLLDDRVDEVEHPTASNCLWGANCTIKWD